jgi:hypothetical protein
MPEPLITAKIKNIPVARNGANGADVFIFSTFLFNAGNPLHFLIIVMEKGINGIEWKSGKA